MPAKLRKRLYSLSGPILKPASKIAWFFYVRMSEKLRVIIGSGDTLYWGWFPTDIKTLDITDEKDLKFYFEKRKMDFLLAEHVLEHLEYSELELMALNIKKYSNKGVNFRVAVPDGYHTDKSYIDHVRPGGTGPAADDHKHLFNYRSLSSFFEKYGYNSTLVEYWDENGVFRTNYKNGDGKGHIRRCFLNHRKNIDGKPNYTSLIIDFTL